MQFNIGDRVRVTEDWFVAELRGETGTVAMPPEGVPDRRDEGIYWIELDVEDKVITKPGGSFADSAEIDANCLRSI